MRYKPSVLLGGNQWYSLNLEKDSKSLEMHQIQILQKHFHQLIYEYGYGDQIIVNLLNQKGMEHPLGHSYALAISMLNDNKVK